jgi:predicted ATPase/DNA-binding SARP family transcriptional activator
MPSLALSLFGSFQAKLGGRPIETFAYDKVRALLAYLALAPDGTLARNTLAALLWPEHPDATARGQLRSALATLRAALRDATANPPFLLATRHTLQLNPHSDYTLDVATFTALRKEVDAHRHAPEELCGACVERLKEAVALYRGSFLDQLQVRGSVAWDEWLYLTRAELQRQAHEILATLMRYYEHCGNDDLAQQYAWRLLALEPWDEVGHRCLMRALARSGQRTQALQHYEHFRHQLAEELRVEPDDMTTALYEAMRRGQPFAITPNPERPASQASPVQLFDVRPGNMPTPMTALIGRTEESVTLSALLGRADVRLITLTGTGGIGKTRLAMEVAQEMQHAFTDGVWFVSLAPVRDSALVAEAIAQALGTPESSGEPLPRLRAVLRGRAVLLVLDNFEHILGASGLLSELLAACPRLKIVTTSRVRLNLYGEWELPVAPLSLPPEAAALSAEQALASESVQLFVARAQAARHGYLLDDADAPAVAALCRHLGGLPLAIELAAARRRDRSAQTLFAQLVPALPLLTGGPEDVPERLRSMHGAIAWSYALLSPTAQALFRRLSVFVGGWTLDAAMGVCPLNDSASEQVPGLLTALCEHQLVQTESWPNDNSRYTIFEVIREFALEQLQHHNESRLIQHRHAIYYCALAEQAAPQLRGVEQLAWLRRLEQEHPNMRAALRWCLDGDGEATLGVHLAATLSWFWWLQSQCNEGKNWLTRALALSPAVAPEARATLLCMLSLMAVLTSEVHQGEQWATEALILAQARGDSYTASWAATLAGVHFFYRGENSRGTPLLVDALQLALALNDRWLTVAIVWNLAAGDLQVAQRLFSLDEGLRLAETTGERWNMAGMRLVASWKHFADGDTEGAVALLERAAQSARELGDRRMLVSITRSLARMQAALGALERALEHYTICLRLNQAIGDSQFTAVAYYEIGQTRLALGDATAARAAFLESLAQARAVPGVWGAAVWLLGFAALAPSPLLAVRLLSAAQLFLTTGNHAPDPFVKQDYEEILVRVRSSLDATTFEAAWCEGQTLSLEQASLLAGS